MNYQSSQREEPELDHIRRSTPVIEFRDIWLSKSWNDVSVQPTPLLGCWNFFCWQQVRTPA